MKKRLFINSRGLKQQARWLLAILLLGFSLPALSQQERRAGIGTGKPEARLDVIGKVKADTVGRPAGDFYIQAGQDIRLLTGSAGAVTPGINGGSLGSAALNWSALYAHKMEVGLLAIPLHAGAGKVLISDATGNGAWNTVAKINLDSVYYPHQGIGDMAANVVNARPTSVRVNRDQTVTLPYDNSWLVTVTGVQSGCNQGREVSFPYIYWLYFDKGANRWKIVQNGARTTSCGTDYLWFGLWAVKLRQ